ncbi:MAG: hypothetical protein H6626_02520 [Pseudobdellovibrionaceae bacterium]|nr:MAG: hypothetical protein H6626_02520 [Pseudobdellovibrionaceae bacterium]
MAIHVMFSVDWEGTSLLPENLEAMNELSAKYPIIPRIQFLNPAYFIASENWPTDGARELVRLGISDSDEIGLHVHCWERLLRAAHVNFLSQPSFFDGGESWHWNNEYGGDIPVTSYSQSELEALFAFSLKTLSHQGYTNIKSFRGGGWCSSPHLQKALSTVGLYNDSSPVPPHLVQQKYPNTFLYDMALQHWPTTNEISFPFSTTLDGKVVNFFPNNACLVDYVPFEQAHAVFEAVVEKSRQSKVDGYFHYGWHQETLVQALRRQTDDTFLLKSTNYYAEIDQMMGYLSRRASSGLEINFCTIESFNRTQKI